MRAACGHHHCPVSGKNGRQQPLTMRNLAPLPVATSTNNVSRRGIVWLASYPKSGNTWFRIFLRYLLDEPDEDEDLSAMTTGISSHRDLFDTCTGLDSSNLTAEEIDGLRPRVYEQVAGNCRTQPVFLKAHDAFTYLPNGEPLLSRQATAGAIYFLRNPLDVAVSYAYHSGHDDFAKVILNMASRERALQKSTDGLDSQLRQQLLDWSGHVRSWLDQTDIPVHVLRYEDMLAKPLETFRGAVQFAGLEYDDSQIVAALDQCRFERLQEKERERGFRERLPKAKVFFREGRAGSWRDKLTDDLVTRVLSDHGEVMRRFHYLNERGELLA